MKVIISGIALAIAGILTLGITLAAFRAFDEQAQIVKEDQGLMRNARGFAFYSLYLRTAESSKRGYVITGDSRYLDKYYEAVKTMWEFDKNMPSDSLREKGIRKLGEMDRVIRLCKEGKHDQAIILINEAMEYQFMSEIHDEALAGNIECNRKRTANGERSNQIFNTIRTLVVLGGGLAVSLSVWAVTVLVRESARRSKRDAMERHIHEQLRLAREIISDKGHFFNSLSHDLRTPLNGMGLMIEVAETSQDDPDTLRLALGEIKLCADTITKLLNSLSEMGRLESIPPIYVTIHVDNFMTEILHLLQVPAQAKNLELSLDYVSGTTMVSDRSMLFRICMNLVSNAIKYTNEGSVTVRLEVNLDKITFSVIDTGIGIAADKIDKLFTEFYQINNVEQDAAKGFGLGLSICKRLAERLGGTIKVHSELSVGSTFTLIVPNGE